jgi:mitochondrial enoyl-[acyl-carrier protein] reductase / trans-2-enoyl-CoA reductase
MYHELSYKSKGEPIHVLEYRRVQDEQAPSLAQPPSGSRPTNAWLQLQMHAVPWNPADLNAVQGKYADPYDLPHALIEPSLPALLRKSQYAPGSIVAGSEGIGQVQKCLWNQTDLKEGDWVVIGLPGLGTLRSQMWLPREAVLSIPSDLVDTLSSTTNDSTLHSNRLTVQQASSYFQLAATAYRMLRDFVPNWRPGDVVIQNAGNSSVGYMVAQLVPTLAHNMTLVNVVRKGSRSDQQVEAMRKQLESTCPSSILVLEEDWQDPEAFRAWQHDFLQNHSSPRLALNAVGGDSATRLWKLLGSEGTMVTYGGLSMAPMNLSTPTLIFQDKLSRGYWNSAWMASHSLNKRQEMVDRLSNLVLQGKVHGPPVQAFALQDWKAGLEFASSQSGETTRRKLVYSLAE